MIPTPTLSWQCCQQEPQSPKKLDETGAPKAKLPPAGAPTPKKLDEAGGPKQAVPPLGAPEPKTLVAAGAPKPKRLAGAPAMPRLALSLPADVLRPSLERFALTSRPGPGLASCGRAASASGGAWEAGQDGVASGSPDPPAAVAPVGSAEPHVQQLPPSAGLAKVHTPHAVSSALRADTHISHTPLPWAR